VKKQRGFTLVELMIVLGIILVLASVLWGVSGRQQNANSEIIAEQVAATFTYARTRAISTRKVHKVRIYTSGTEQAMLLTAYSTTGMSAPTSTSFQTLEYKRIPRSAIVWAASAGVVSAGAVPSQNTALDYTLTFKPDGSATASTIYITDRDTTMKKYRVVVYNVTGSVYARNTW
jgi:prepilin-type N-terminal cleavage/methylation domain-containing protein